PATVLWVIDGDTVIVRIGGERARVRLIGIDAPETWLRHDCFGAEATAALRRLLPPGSTVHTAGDVEPRDQYGRLLVYLWTRGGDFVNARLISMGFARTMTVPPNTSYVLVLQQAERMAQRARRGLWQACT